MFFYQDLDSLVIINIFRFGFGSLGSCLVQGTYLTAFRG